MLRARINDSATTTFISGAAFATQCTILVRGLVVSTERVMQLLSAVEARQVVKLVGVKEIYNALEGLIEL